MATLTRRGCNTDDAVADALISRPLCSCSWALSILFYYYVCRREVSFNKQCLCLTSSWTHDTYGVLNSRNWCRTRSSFSAARRSIDIHIVAITIPKHGTHAYFGVHNNDIPAPGHLVCIAVPPWDQRVFKGLAGRPRVWIGLSTPYMFIGRH